MTNFFFVILFILSVDYCFYSQSQLTLILYIILKNKKNERKWGKKEMKFSEKKILKNDEVMGSNFKFWSSSLGPTLKF